MNTLIAIFVWLFGLCIGSFLNVVIYRLEKKETVGGRSYCPNCHHQLQWHDLIPLVSFLWLGATCRYCQKSISWQYPIVELATAFLFLLTFIIFLPSLSLFSLIYLCFLLYVIAALVVIFAYDVS